MKVKRASLSPTMRLNIQTEHSNLTSLPILLCALQPCDTATIQNKEPFCLNWFTLRSTESQTKYIHVVFLT